MLDINKVAKTINRYSSSGETPIHSPIVLPGGNNHVPVLIAHQSHGTLKIRLPITQRPNVFRYRQSN